jgi:hypothetical protein
MRARTAASLLAGLVVGHCAPAVFASTDAGSAPAAAGSIIDVEHDGIVNYVSPVLRISDVSGEPFSMPILEYDISALRNTTIYSASIHTAVAHDAGTSPRTITMIPQTADGKVTATDTNPLKTFWGGNATTVLPGTTSTQLAYPQLIDAVQYLASTNATHLGTKYFTLSELAADFDPDHLPALQVVRSSDHVPTVNASPMNLPTKCVYVASEAGDPIGLGQTILGDGTNGGMMIGRRYNGIEIQFSGGGHNVSMYLRPKGDLLPTMGDYEGTLGSWYDSFSPTLHGLTVSVDGRYPVNVSGRFSIYDVELGQNPNVMRLAASFELHGNRSVPALHGQVRWNSSVPEPGSIASVAGGALVLMSRRRRSHS